MRPASLVGRLVGMRPGETTPLVVDTARCPATQAFWTFVAVCRNALDRLEAAQIKDPPALRCPGS